VSRWLHKIASILPWLEPLVLGMAAPFLLFPTARPRWTAVMLAWLAACYLLRWIVRLEPWPSPPFNAIVFSVHDRRSFLWGVAALALVGRDLTHGPLRFVYRLLLVDHTRGMRPACWCVRSGLATPAVRQGHLLSALGGRV
jgi:hypothetical protein